MDIKELLRQVRTVELQTRRLVRGSLTGAYHSAFRGSGMQFSETRAYVPGDDVRHIAWNLSARSQATQVKQFEEERELHIILAVDVSRSEVFGGAQATVSFRLTRLAAAIALSALANQDRVGCVLFSDRILKTLPAKKSRFHILRLIRDLLATSPPPGKSRLEPLLSYLESRVKRRSVVFILTDGLFPPPAVPLLRRISKRHEVIALAVADPFESFLPPTGLVKLRDPETGGEAIVDTGWKTVADGISRQIQAARDVWSRTLRRANIDVLTLTEPKEDLSRLALFFEGKKGKQGYAP